MERDENALKEFARPKYRSPDTANDSKEEKEELPLSPIQSRSVTPLNNIRQSHEMTLASTNLDPLSSVKQVKTVEINREVNHSAVWSNEQFNYFRSDMMQEMEGKRNNSRPEMQRTDDFSTDDQIRLLQNTMHRSNPSTPIRTVTIAGLHFRGNGLQYATLNLEGLQITFDHFNAAHESIQEAIRVSQHHGDHICMTFALAWMMRINQKVGATKENIRQLVGSSLDRSKELRLPALQVLATLTEVE
ncbi:hypothetical protein PsorP6_000538 [Peronosclerospora sorghi]|uniref:Uncharacterized protein n=1 Tax=Peronosclerospora sorghi TaxID=230839 RepID=A0ACC0WQB0_9STRA|nr:hypothetical protein PsorP6_000538 [Peronosclerospora sorghi]